MENINKGGMLVMLSMINYVKELEAEQKASNTITKYKSDVKEFKEEIGKGRVTDKKLADYKAKLVNHHKPSTVNSKLITVNNYLERSGINKSLRLLNIKRNFFLDDDILLSTSDIHELEEYCRKNNNYRLYYLIRTYTKTGIRVSEHEFITVEAVKKGMAIVENKGSIRKVIIPKNLKKELLAYIEIEGIKEGPIFITKNDNPVDRRNIWADLQKVGQKLNINKEKLHPHNFRHYFARVNYKKTKDVVKLAAMLGHSNIETTRNYLKVLASEIREDMDKIEEEIEKEMGKVRKKKNKPNKNNKGKKGKREKRNRYEEIKKQY